METIKGFIPRLYELNDHNFRDIALEIFQFQAQNNSVYRDYINYLKVVPAKISRLEDIPFLPVTLFKSHTIQTGRWLPHSFFTSSGTTAANPARHAVHDLDFYLSHSRYCFERFFGPVTDYHFLALLPSYLEREGSSLIAMLDYFIRASGSKESGFFLRDHAALLTRLAGLRDRKVLLWGVSFALLDLAGQHDIDLSHCTIVETGGMKGRRREITRYELHGLLSRSFHNNRIYSEYGMTELFSQAYTAGDTLFRCPPSMRVIGREVTDPFTRGVTGETCALNIIDLANVHSIAFIETEDLGKVYADGSFEVLGRLDNSDVRGCNLMV